ncbi:MAG: transposase, partial [bacterium]|nr:transposase [bacterium]
SIRSHWAIENSLHWVLDVAFNEDQSRIRIGHAAENMATIIKINLNTEKKNKTSKRDAKGERKQAAWDNSYLEELIMQV